MGNADTTHEMTSTRSASALIAVAGLIALSISSAHAGSALSLPSSPEIAATAPAASSQAGRGVLGKWDSNPWVPVAAILSTIAAGPLVRRYLAR